MNKKNNQDSTISTTASTAVTKVAVARKQSEHPLMSFTAVLSHQAMAEAFVNELLLVAQNLIPDHTVTAEEVISIFQRALDEQNNRNITLVNGRHLRARVAEQVSRAKRYKEPFSLLVLNLDKITVTDDYDAVVDTLRERMRQTDLIFLFKHRIVLLLPHTGRSPCELLKDRIQLLLNECMVNLPKIPIKGLTFPNATMTKTMQVLDWAENSLRS